MNFEVGTVFRWDNFPDPRHGTTRKARWFIYLGESGYFSQVVIAYICTTTTQISHFEPGGDRRSHSHYILHEKNSPFDEDCALDYDQPPYVIPKSQLENNKDIVIKGNLQENTMRMIYNRILKSDEYSRIMLREIHESFNKVGIEGLKKVK